MDHHAFPPYVNIPPIAKTRSITHLAPTPEHHRSASYEETTTASTSTDSVPEVRIRSESSQVSFDSPQPIQKMYVAAYEYVAQNRDELDLPLGAIVKLVTAETQEDGWYKGELGGRIGLFPSNYARLLPEAENHLVEFTTEDIKVPDSSRTLEDFRIGHGATATVFKIDIKAKKEILNGSMGYVSQAALKRYNKLAVNRGDITEAEQLEQLKREANLVNGLSHKNIVGLLGICLEDPYFGLLLELCEGSSLRTVCSSTDKPMPVQVLVNWAEQVAAGMEYLTKEGYVHRDLKADNVLVKEEVCLCIDDETMKYDWCSKCGRRPLNKLQLKITDFGVTRKMTAENRHSTAGTYAWLAPEAFRDGAWSEASDVWSYGVVLWEILSRKEPYQGQIPATIAFQIALRGQSLLIDEHCPAKWKDIMQKCWELQPSDRPNFSSLVQYFKEYSMDIKDTESHLTRVQSITPSNDIYSRIAPRKDLEKMFNDIYSVKGDINRKNRGSIAPETKTRKAKLHNKKKLEITGPMGDMKHIVSVQLDKNDKNFKIKYPEHSSGGTLPRLNDRQSSLSISSPDLFQMPEILNGSATVGHSAARISRKNAIRFKRNPHNMFESPVVSPTHNDSNDFAKIDNAFEMDPSPSKEHKNGTFSRVWSKLPWKNHKRDSKDDNEPPGSISSRSSSTTSSNRIISGQASRAAAAAPFLETGVRSRAQSAAEPWDDPISSRKNKISPSDKRPVKQTNLTERFVKEPDVIRPGHLPSHHRKSALDQTIPASPNSPDSITNFPPMPVNSSSRRTTANSSSDGAPSYEILVTNPQGGAGHGQKNRIIQPSLSDYVPIAAQEEQTHFEMGPGWMFDRNRTNGQNAVYGHIGGSHSISQNGGHGHGKPVTQSTQYYPVGGGCDSYIPIVQSRVVRPTVGEVSNSPYSDNLNCITRKIQNDQYIHCSNKTPPATKPPTLPMKIQSENNLVTTSEMASSPRIGQLNGIGISPSSLSLNEPPDIPAPLPPRLSISPPTRLAPVLPRRDGSLSPDPTTILDTAILKRNFNEGTEIF